MTYKDRFVAVIKCNNRILREIDGFVTLPFGSEYSILLKNLNSRRALVSICIDGQDVLGSRSLIVDPMQTIELDCFIDHSLTQGLRFKFVQKTEDVVDSHGDRIDDGMVRIEYRYELPYPSHEDKQKTETQGESIRILDLKPLTADKKDLTMSEIFQKRAPFEGEIPEFMHKMSEFPGIQEHEGITVKGSASDQKFAPGMVGPLEHSSNVIIIRLRGYIGDKPAQSPLTVRDKVKCPTCGRISRSDKKYCSECGTRLH